MSNLKNTLNTPGAIFRRNKKRYKVSSDASRVECIEDGIEDTIIMTVLMMEFLESPDNFEECCGDSDCTDTTCDSTDSVEAVSTACCGGGSCTPNLVETSSFDSGSPDSSSSFDSGGSDFGD